MIQVRALLSKIQLEYPVVDETRCNGCGHCVEVCPTECLAMDGPLPWLPIPGDCIRCGLCIAICPTQALTMGSEMMLPPPPGQMER